MGGYLGNIPAEKYIGTFLLDTSSNKGISVKLCAANLIPSKFRSSKNSKL